MLHIRSINWSTRSGAGTPTPKGQSPSPGAYIDEQVVALRSPICTRHPVERTRRTPVGCRRRAFSNFRSTVHSEIIFRQQHALNIHYKPSEIAYKTIVRLHFLY